MSDAIFTQDDVDKVRALAFACECEDASARTATWARWLDTLADRLARVVTPAAQQAPVERLLVAAEDARKASPHRFPTTL